MIITIYATLIVLMYILSGINKIRTFDATVKSLEKHFFINTLPNYFYVISIILVIILQIFGSLIIIYSIHTNKYKKYAFYSCIGLAIFTILATLLYHFPPNGAQYYPFVSNITSLGALLLLSTFFTKNNFYEGLNIYNYPFIFS